MFASVFLALFVATPLTLTFVGLFRRGGDAPVNDDPMPRWGMQDFKPRD
jgi:hypothetical protein